MHRKVATSPAPKHNYKKTAEKCGEENDIETCKTIIRNPRVATRRGRQPGNDMGGGQWNFNLQCEIQNGEPVILTEHVSFSERHSEPNNQDTWLAAGKFVAENSDHDAARELLATA